MTTERNSRPHADHEIPPIGGTEHADDTASATASTSDAPADTSADTPQRRRMSPRRVRRIKRRRRIRRLLIVVLAILLGLLGLAGWFGISAWQAKQEADAVLTAATGIQESISTGDMDALDEQITELTDHVHGAYAQTSSTIWTLASHIPYIGVDVTAVRTAVTAMENICVQAMPGLQDALRAVNGIQVENGTIDIGGLSDAADGLAKADTAMTSAMRQLNGIQPPHLDKLADAVEQVQDRLEPMQDMVHNAAVFASVAPAMLDSDGGAPRTYLILSQTNSELRPGGGLPGSWGTMTIANGTMSIQEFAPPPAEFTTPVVTLTAEERALFTDKLARVPQDVNFTPDFPRTGEIAQAMWQQSTQQTVDGVIAIDPVFLQRMLAVSGPVTVSNGVTLDGTNTAQYLLNQVYIDVPEAEQNDYFGDVAATVFAHIMQHVNSPRDFLGAVASSITDGHLKLWSAHQEEQKQLLTTPIAGALKTTASTPEMGVYFSDISQAKMDWYLRREVSVEYDKVGISGGDQYTVRIKLTNMMTAEEAASLPRYIVGPFLDDLTAGQVRTGAFVYAPAGGRLVDWTMSDGSGFDGITVHNGLTVGTKTITLGPGESYEIVCHVQSAPGVHTPLTLVQTPQVEGRTD
ncbi:DUF4012 domain-containing protein [Bifidobacterium pullorum subsp. saeculare]|uniref:DUF4012 domain-containing protein n=1 Tax=Bifidobacterium pullorum TaxID=78448 RepID=UPI00195A860C|nr:DUF4012 domain-containing protein [Bifidobacterium pullorum]MBM6692614.1 DUF4012 domain-containing protein [Bifidobacterium pullorum subsp. saeculare]